MKIKLIVSLMTLAFKDVSGELKVTSPTLLLDLFKETDGEIQA
jgi:hypothetical protein